MAHEASVDMTAGGGTTPMAAWTTHARTHAHAHTRTHTHTPFKQLHLKASSASNFRSRAEQPFK
eukprot:2137334-Amphidinium_carterae.1